MRGEAGQASKLGMPRLLQPDVVVGDHGIDAGDGMPGLSSRRATWNPMKPALPVTRTFIDRRSALYALQIGQNGVRTELPRHGPHIQVEILAVYENVTHSLPIWD